MRQDLTDIVVVLDRSGSMANCKADAEGGLNSFVQQQKELPGEARYTLIQFDTIVDIIHSGIPIQAVPKFSLVPRGGTALLDAIGNAILSTGSRLAALPESERPGLVVMVVVTDGGENSSHEFKRDQIRRMIETQQSVYNWQFSFLGANQDAFAAASGLGFQRSAIANYSERKTSQTFAAASSNVERMRSASAAGEAVVNSYTDSERSQIAPDL